MTEKRKPFNGKNRKSDESGMGRDESGFMGTNQRQAVTNRRTDVADVPLVQAAQNVVPVAATAGDKIEALRQWASGRCLSADRAGVYSRTEVGGSGGRVRKVVRAG